MEYEKCVALDPKMAEAQLNLGILLLEKDATAAVAPLSRAVELLPSQSRPRYLLGLAQERSGDLKGAAESFEGATRLDPKDGESLLELGRIYIKSNRAGDAETKFRAALTLEPKSPEALQGIGAETAASSNPCPNPFVTRATRTEPEARKTTSTNTSPSRRSLRASSVYAGLGFDKITTGCTGRGLSACLGLGASGPATAVPKPPAFIGSRVPSPPEAAEIVTPSPKPELATVPRTPFAPPVPLPNPGPGSRAGEPAWAIFARRVELLSPGRPLGSPNPPV